MTRKIFRSTVCLFSTELRQRQILRGVGLAVIATLVITAHMQRNGHLPVPLPVDVTSPIPVSQQTISSYTPETIPAVVQLTPNSKETSKNTKQLPPHWTLETINIKSSFNTATHQAGLTHEEITSLKQILSDKIDFKHLHQGDQFKILTERVPSTNPQVKPLDFILAARFISKNNRYTAIRYSNPKIIGQVNYYLSNGNSLKPGFLRYPTHYTHIGSGFSLYRLDPITENYHSHPAIDFDAPTNTPIFATGDGKINYIGNEQGYGNVVKIAHSGQVLSLYAHMHRFAKGLHNGSLVQKGEVIGYVGMSGYATGPHVHYELHIGSKPVNPLTCKLPSSNGIPTDQKLKFDQIVREVSRYLS